MANFALCLAKVGGRTQFLRGRFLHKKCQFCVDFPDGPSPVSARFEPFVFAKDFGISSLLWHAGSLASFCTFPPKNLSIFEVDCNLNSQDFSASFFVRSPCTHDRFLHQSAPKSPRCRTLPLQNASSDECAKRLLQRAAYETREKLPKDFTFSRGDSFDLQTFSRPKESTTFRKESRSLSIFGDIVPLSANLSTCNDV